MALDFTRLCRICVEENKQTFDIFTSYCVKTNTSYCDMLAICTILKPHEKDGLPRLICKECYRQLKRTYSFYKKCENSEITLKNYVVSQSEIHQKKPVLLSNGANVNIEITCAAIKDETSCDGTQKEQIPVPDTGEIKENIGIETLLSDDANNDSWDAEDNDFLDVIKLQKSVLQDIKEGPKKSGPKKKAGANIPESKLPHQCDVCGKILSTKSNLKAHKLCHTDLRPYLCPECPATFRGYSALFQHKKIHSGETPYHCEYCPKQFSRRTGLVNHIRMHTGEKQYSCEVCFKTFVQSAQLSTHMKRHNGEKPFLCQVCGKVGLLCGTHNTYWCAPGFPIKSELFVHERVHNGDKPYSCYLCTKTFATSGNLSIHIRIHKKEIRYRCKDCNRGFVTCSSYNVHLKRHKGQRDYHCECGKTFYTSSALKQHKVVHTGEKKYQCKVCDKKFTQTSHLTRHFRKEHAKPNVPVPSSKHYKLVLNGTIDDRLQIIQHNVDVLASNVDNGIKCENS